MHGGTIQVSSEGHRLGSEFTVRLPARLERPARAVESDTQRRPAWLTAGALFP